MKNYFWVLLSIALLLIIVPRWDKSDSGILKQYTYKDNQKTGYIAPDANKEHYSDDLSYVDIVYYYRTGIINQYFGPPYTFRPFVTYSASFLPFKPITSINIINSIFLLITLFSLRGILIKYNFNDKQAFSACSIYVFSFQTFYYSSTGLIDPSIAGWFALIFYLSLSEKHWIVAILLPFAALTKESIIIILPVLMSVIYIQKKSFKSAFVYSTLYFILVLVTLIIARKIVPSSIGFLWESSSNRLLDNILRFRATASTLFTLGIAGMLSIPSIFIIIKKGNILESNYLPLVVAMISFFIFIVYAYFTVRIGGTYYLPCIYFTLPLTMIFLKEKSLPKFLFK